MKSKEYSMILSVCVVILVICNYIIYCAFLVSVISSILIVNGKHDVTIYFFEWGYIMPAVSFLLYTLNGVNEWCYKKSYKRVNSIFSNLIPSKIFTKQFVLVTILSMCLFVLLLK